MRKKSSVRKKMEEIGLGNETLCLRWFWISRVKVWQNGRKK